MGRRGRRQMLEQDVTTRERPDLRESSLRWRNLHARISSMAAMPSPRSRRTLRWALVAGVVLILLVGVAVAVVLLHSPGNVSHPNLSFTAPTTTATTPAPKRKPIVDNFEWPRYGFDPGRNRFFTGAGNLHPPLHVGWVFQDYALLEFPPVMYGHTLFFVDDDGSAKALNARNGRVIWQHKVGSLAAASPALGVRQGLIFLPLLSVNANAGQNPGNGRFLALSMKTGKTVWSHVVPAGSESSPTVSGNSVYFGDQSGAVSSLRATDGHLNWTYHASGAVKGGPALVGGLLYFGDYAGRAYALNAATGHQVWAVATNGARFGFGSGNFYATPAVAFGRVYMGNTDGRVYSFAARTGQLAWATGTSAYVYASSAVADVPGLGPTVYVGSYDGNFYAFNAQSGAVRWTHSAGGKISGSATIVDNVVYFSDLGTRTTLGLDVTSGRTVFRFPDGAFNPVIADPNTIYMAGYSHLYEMLPGPAPPRAHGTRRKG
jgi:outer membrane protein assembly factor BamB